MLRNIIYNARKFWFIFVLAILKTNPFSPLTLFCRYIMFISFIIYNSIIGDCETPSGNHENQSKEIFL